MSKYKILIIDDEVKIVESLRRELVFFTEIGNIEVLTAASAAQGLEILESAHKDVALIISDQRMPEMSGSDFLLRIKQLYPDIITMLMSANTDIDELIKGIKAGIFSFIIKPWNKNLLIAEIEKALELYSLRVSKKEFLDMIREELQWGGELQKTILRRVLPDSPYIRFSVTYMPLPALNCGGDYYDVVEMGRGLYLVLIGDVSGHGIKGAFITAILKSIIYSEYVSKHREGGFSPADFLGWLNNRVCEELKKLPDIVITFSACYLNLINMRIKFAKAGHLPLVIVREGRILTYDIEGRGMGFSPDAVYKELEIPVQSRDRLVFYTDGLVEYPGKGGTSNFLDLSEIIPEVNDTDDFHETILKNARGAFPGGDFSDDVTLITAAVKGNPA